MGRVADHHAELYTRVWGTVPGYRTYSPGAQYVESFQEVSGAPRGAVVLDAGCGAGGGALALQAFGYRVLGCDCSVVDGLPVPIVRANLWHDLSPVDYLARSTWNGQGIQYVYCTDVLEHLPESLTMLAVHQMVQVAHDGVFLSVSTDQDAFGVWAGEALHQTVKPFVWWRDQLAEVAEVVDARDCLGPALFYLRGARC